MILEAYQSSPITDSVTNSLPVQPRNWISNKQPTGLARNFGNKESRNFLINQLTFFPLPVAWLSSLFRFLSTWKETDWGTFPSRNMVCEGAKVTKQILWSEIQEIQCSERKCHTKNFEKSGIQFSWSIKHENDEPIELPE